jgi:hypothetical protein
MLLKLPGSFKKFQPENMPNKIPFFMGCGMFSVSVD